MFLFKKKISRAEQLSSLNHLEEILKNNLNKYKNNPKTVDDAIKIENRLRELRTKREILKSKFCLTIY